MTAENAKTPGSKKTKPCRCSKCGDIHRALDPDFKEEQRAKKRERRKCVECREEVLYTYMLKDAIWERARLREGNLHLACFEKRSGLELEIEDFKQNVPCNEIILWAWRRGIYER